METQQNKTCGHGCQMQKHTSSVVKIPQIHT